jgi:hypothetical protein
MKNKIIGIFVCILMIVTALPVISAANVQSPKGIPNEAETHLEVMY